MLRNRQPSIILCLTCATKTGVPAGMGAENAVGGQASAAVDGTFKQACDNCDVSSVSDWRHQQPAGGFADRAIETADSHLDFVCL